MTKRVISHEDVKQAILEQQAKANKRREKQGKPPIKIIVLVQDLLPEPEDKKRLIVCKGIKATNGITWFKGDPGRIVNHVFPDNDRTEGLELGQVVECEYPTNFIDKPYKRSELTKEPEVKHKS